MNINRHNYETFFLLYVDNELSAAERKAVEQFLLENTDLKPELQLLLETTLPIETVSFNAKDGLYKNEVELDILQENLLLYLDNELNPATARKMEISIASDQSIEQEWKILQQTKLESTEKVIFENKSILYRHERDRIITIRFWRVAAAAAILFACLFTTVSLLKKYNPNENATTAKTNKTIKSSFETGANDNIQSGNKFSDSLQMHISGNIATIKEKEKTNTTPVNKTNLAQHKNETIFNNQLVKEEKNIVPKTPLENINKEKSNETITAAVLHKNNEPVTNDKIPVEIASSSMNKKITAPSAPVVDYNSIPAMPDSYAKTTGLNEMGSDNNNKILYMNEENVTRSKIGGLFRRVKRVIERNTNIKTGNGVKIAGFEIAVK